MRIINRKTAQRTLLKGFTGRVQDISFAHLSALVLGCVDEAGDMFINEVHDGADGNITYPSFMAGLSVVHTWQRCMERTTLLHN